MRIPEFNPAIHLLIWTVCLGILGATNIIGQWVIQHQRQELTEQNKEIAALTKKTEEISKDILVIWETCPGLTNPPSSLKVAK